MENKILGMKQINKIKGYEKVKEGYYVTTCGKVISTRRHEVKILKGMYNRKGYLFVDLQIEQEEDGIRRRKIPAIHRLVALAFIPNPENKKQVNHINEVKTDNYVGNLEWMTCTENNNWGTRNERAGKAISLYAKNNDNKEHYATTPTIRTGFKKVCRRKGWKFEDFEEVFAEWHIFPNTTKKRKFIYLYHPAE